VTPLLALIHVKDREGATKGSQSCDAIGRLPKRGARPANLICINNGRDDRATRL
jgi:hypothetical protein